MIPEEEMSSQLGPGPLADRFFTSLFRKEKKRGANDLQKINKVRKGWSIFERLMSSGDEDDLFLHARGEKERI